MGDTLHEGYEDELPVHRVRVGDFWMDRFEVTFEAYDRFCEATNRLKPDDNGFGRGKRPVINVTWYDAVEFCNWRSSQAGVQPCYEVEKTEITEGGFAKTRIAVRCNWRAGGYRLPTEAEWEYAARGGGQAVRFGNDKMIADPVDINFDGRPINADPYTKPWVRRDYTMPVGALPSSNRLGLYDMSGNVWEWCWDFHHPHFYRESGPAENPTGPAQGKLRVIRGGGWRSPAKGCRVSYRGNYNPNNRSFDGGFRCVRNGK